MPNPEASVAIRMRMTTPTPMAITPISATTILSMHMDTRNNPSADGGKNNDGIPMIGLAGCGFRQQRLGLGQVLGPVDVEEGIEWRSRIIHVSHHLIARGPEIDLADVLLGQGTA